jgi:hypothetical protein
MRLEVIEHRCAECNRYFTTADTEIDHMYHAICRICMEKKIISLEQKIDVLYGYFQATINMRIK